MCPRGYITRLQICSTRVRTPVVPLHSLSDKPFWKVWTPLSSHLWLKYYHYCPYKKRMVLALNKPRKLICNKITHRVREGYHKFHREQKVSGEEKAVTRFKGSSKFFTNSLREVTLSKGLPGIKSYPKVN